MSKMQAIVSRLDGLTSELCAHDSELITSEIESVRQHILRSTSRIYRSTAIPIPLLADPDHDAERVRDEESDNNAVRKVCDNGSSVMDLESEVADKKMELHSCTRLETDVRDLNDVVNKFSRLVWVSSFHRNNNNCLAIFFSRKRKRLIASKVTCWMHGIACIWEQLSYQRSVTARPAMCQH